MLEKLGSVLRKVTDKIASAIFVDKKLIDSVIKDLQRALIEADINVSLVKQISDELRQQAIDEKIKGIEKKEQIIKFLHDKLLDILGGKKQELIIEKGTSKKIMLLGLYGSGKCVHANSNIQLSNGNILKIKDLYQTYKDKLPTRQLEDGEIIEVNKENLYVPSFNLLTKKIENKKITHLWKLEKSDLINVELDNGNDYSIKVTPEHPFFIMRDGQVLKIRADEIKESDYIAIPKRFEIKGNTICLFEQLKQLNLLVYLSNEEIKGVIKNREIKEICAGLKLKKNYCHLTSLMKKGAIPIELLQENDYNFLKVKNYQSQKIITIPTYMTSDLAEFLGYLMGDGHIDEKYIEIVSEDQEVISRILSLSKMLFNIAPSIKRDLRTKNMYKIVMASKTLVEILKIFSLKSGAKGKKLEIPKQIMLSNSETIRSYIKSYFDCDSSPSKNRRIVELTSESEILIKQMNLLLRRFNIHSTISKKRVNNVPYWRIIISARSAEVYASKIGSIIKHKVENLSKFDYYGKIQGCGKQDMIPIGKLLKLSRLTGGFSIGEIQENAVLSYGRYEDMGLISREKLFKLVEYYKTNKKGIIINILDKINKSELKEISNGLLNALFYHLKKLNFISANNKKISLTNSGLVYLNEYKFEIFEKLITHLDSLANSDINWIPLKSVKPVINDEKVVYDMTVEDNHSFIAEGFIVHNTTTTAKLANYYNKRGLKTCILGLDVHRPAAREQLEQLGIQNNLKIFINKEENNPVKIYKQFLKQLEEYDLIIIDTAGRHSLDKDLVDEIKNLNKTIKPDYTILVMPADIGQAAKKQAEEFQKALSINGVIVTRMDSTAKAGGALTACHETQAPVFFITTGEKVNDLETFNPESFLARLLGMGDLQALMEKIKLVQDGGQDELDARIKQGKFTMLDFYEQLKGMESFSFSKMLDLVPGIGKLKEKLSEDKIDSQQANLKKWKHAIDSMTKEERENPEIIEKQTSRISRIAKGAGITTSTVRELLSQYNLIKSFVKSGKNMEDMDISKLQKGGLGISQKKLRKLAKKFGKF